VAAFQPYEEDYRRIKDAFDNAITSGGHPSQEILVKNVEVSAKRAEVYHRVDVEFSNELTRQLQLARTISILSPAALYDQVMLRYARTGMAEYERFMDGLARYWRKHVEHEKLLYQDREAYKRTKMPDFSYPSETIAESFASTFPQLIILFLFSVIFFILAYTAFLRKDVR